MTAKSITIEKTKTHTVHQWDFPKLMKAHKQLTSYEYKKQKIDRGYANRSLHVNLSSGKIKEKKEKIVCWWQRLWIKIIMG